MSNSYFGVTNYPLVSDGEAAADRAFGFSVADEIRKMTEEAELHIRIWLLYGDEGLAQFYAASAITCIAPTQDVSTKQGSSPSKKT